jgi:hypothetical protein
VATNESLASGTIAALVDDVAELSGEIYEPQHLDVLIRRLAALY